jgi:alpha-mannosidase
MTLLKSSNAPDRWQDFGMRKFVYRAVFHNTEWLEAHLPHLHEELVVVPVAVNGNATSSGTLGHSEAFVRINDDWIILETLKVAEAFDGFVARFYEASGGTRIGLVEFPLLKRDDWTDPIIVDFHEDQLDSGRIERVNASHLAFYVKLNTFQILNLKIVRSK